MQSENEKNAAEIQEIKCKACDGEMPVLSKEEIEKFIETEAPEWSVTSDGKRLYRKFLCADFQAGIEFITALAAECDGQQHHPSIHYSHYRHLIIEFFTYSVDGVTENDLIMAKVTDRVAKTHLKLSKYYQTKEQRQHAQKPVHCNYEDIYYPSHGPHSFSDKKSHT